MPGLFSDYGRPDRGCPNRASYDRPCRYIAELGAITEPPQQEHLPPERKPNDSGKHGFSPPSPRTFGAQPNASTLVEECRTRLLRAAAGAQEHGNVPLRPRIQMGVSNLVGLGAMMRRGRHHRPAGPRLSRQERAGGKRTVSQRRVSAEKDAKPRWCRRRKKDEALLIDQRQPHVEEEIRRQRLLLDGVDRN